MFVQSFVYCFSMCERARVNVNIVDVRMGSQEVRVFVCAHMHMHTCVRQSVCAV